MKNSPSISSVPPALKVYLSGSLSGCNCLPSLSHRILGWSPSGLDALQCKVTMLCSGNVWFAGPIWIMGGGRSATEVTCNDKIHWNFAKPTFYSILSTFTLSMETWHIHFLLNFFLVKFFLITFFVMHFKELHKETLVENLKSFHDKMKLPKWNFSRISGKI